MRPFGGRSGGRLARLSAFAVLTLALVLSGAGTASAVSISHDSNVAAGNNGTLKVHEKDTSTGTESNDPKVCVFNLEGFNFDPGQDLVLAFQVQGGDEPTGQVPTPNAFNVQADNEGYFASSYFNDGAGSPTILAGHYKVVAYGKDTGTGQFTDEKAKSKVFKVSCGAPATPTGTLTVKKALAEGSAPAGDQKFEINVTCERADYNKTFHLAVGQSATTDPLAAGTSCMVSEDAKDGWAPTTRSKVLLYFGCWQLTAIGKVRLPADPLPAASALVTVMVAFWCSWGFLKLLTVTVTVVSFWTVTGWLGVMVGTHPSFASSLTVQLVPAGSGSVVADSPTARWKVLL